METILKVKLNNNKIFKVWNDNIDSQIQDEHFQEFIFVSNYKNFGDINNERKIDFQSLAQGEKIEGYEIIPIYGYIHSEIRLSVKAFSCPWDSGVFGALVFKKGTFGKYKQKGIDSFVKTWQDLINGEIYGFTIEEEKICNLGCKHSEVVDSVGGFFGYENRNDLINSMLQHVDLSSEEIKKIKGEI